MTDALEALNKRFGAENLTVIDEIRNYNIAIVLVNPKLNRDFSVLMTCGLLNYAMPYNDKEDNEPFIELCFALPSYWDFDFKTDNTRWVIDKLKFLVDFCLSKQTHFWNGHSMPNANPNRPFSATMKQDNLFIAKPMLFEQELSIIKTDEKTVHLLFLIPIFQKELEHKFSRGIVALKKKLVSKNFGEIVDDFRESAVKPWLGIF
jgi:hypothetical protein